MQATEEKLSWCLCSGPYLFKGNSSKGRFWSFLPNHIFSVDGMFFLWIWQHKLFSFCLMWSLFKNKDIAQPLEYTHWPLNMGEILNFFSFSFSKGFPEKPRFWSFFTQSLFLTWRRLFLLILKTKNFFVSLKIQITSNLRHCANLWVPESGPERWHFCSAFSFGPCSCFDNDLVFGDELLYFLFEFVTTSRPKKTSQNILASGEQ